jgi:hypothetical protein
VHNIEDMSDLEKKLVERLHSIAAYNDKGFFWMNHSMETTLKLRNQWQGEIADLVAQIGQNRFSAELLNDLSSPEIVRDYSRDYARKIELWLRDF